VIQVDLWSLIWSWFTTKIILWRPIASNRWQLMTNSHLFLVFMYLWSMIYNCSFLFLTFYFLLQHIMLWLQSTCKISSLQFVSIVFMLLNKELGYFFCNHKVWWQMLDFQLPNACDMMEAIMQGCKIFVVFLMYMQWLITHLDVITKTQLIAIITSPNFFVNGNKSRGNML